MPQHARARPGQAVPAAAGRALTARLRPLYATAFIQNFALWYSIEKLYMQSIGMNDYLITVATVIYVVVMAVVTVPLGVIADRWGRKRVLQLATCFLIASTVICGLARGFGVYAAGYVVWGLFYSCYRTYDSVVYDTVLEVTGSRDGYETCYGKVQQCAAAAFVSAALASTVLVHFTSLRAQYLLTVPVICGAFATLARFREPRLHARERARAGEHLRRLRLALTASPRVALITAALTCDLLATRMLEVFCQLWWLGIALPAALFGPAYAALYAGSYAGGQLAARVRQPALLAAAILAAGMCLLVRSAPVLVAGQVAVIGGLIVLQVVLYGWLHDATPSSVRAATSSASAAAGMTAFIPVALCFGATSQSAGVFAASWFLVGVLAVLAAAVGAAVVLAPAPVRVRARQAG